MKKCPRCGFASTDSAQHCDCGWDFSASNAEPPNLPDCSLPESTPQRVFSPGQVILGTILGSPVCGAYFVARNCTAMNAPGSGQAYVVGLAILLASFAIGFQLPPEASSSGVSGLAAAIFVMYARHIQGNKVTEAMQRGAAKYSWWTAAAISLVFMVGVFAAVAVVFIAAQVFHR